jgi:hypothetical protein
MRKVLLLILFAALMTLPFSVSAEPVNTIDELVALDDSAVCADCHDDIHEDWQKSWHGQSMTDTRVLRAFRTYIKSGLDTIPGGEGRKNFKDVCLSCHVPMGIGNISEKLGLEIADLIITAVEDKDEAKKTAAINELSKLNISCIGCHNIFATPDGSAKPKTIYGPGTSDEPPHMEEFGYDTVASEYIKSPEFCGKCHGCPLPSDQCPTIQSSYDEEYLAHGGDKRCQDCHMSDEISDTTHRFPGIYEVDFAKTGVEITLNASPTTSVDFMNNKMLPTVVINAQLKNTSGHGLPHG